LGRSGRSVRGAVGTPRTPRLELALSGLGIRSEFLESSSPRVEWCAESAPWCSVGGDGGGGRVFFGESSHSLDAYLTRGQDKCLYFFSESGFRRALDELNTRVFSGEDVRGVMRVFFANT